ncbi:four helix bundle protein [Algoriella sp.]|uniref:four helix bundle protein n=1 Tax=Algoriella sp. TaxID=1872434 RepID=UPI001B17171A|nr:four helix bundle protein [Algoriella sp.]MBO6212900.1 four helix bundle protein [Algoriella sp.]
MSSFESLLVWQKAHELTLKIYEITKLFPKEEIFGITSQIRRAASSVPANIVEGRKKKTVPHRLTYISHSVGSLEEVKYFLLLSRDLNYISNELYENLKPLTDDVGKLLNGYEKFIKNDNYQS